MISSTATFINEMIESKRYNHEYSYFSLKSEKIGSFYCPYCGGSRRFSLRKALAPEFFDKDGKVTSFPVKMTNDNIDNHLFLTLWHFRCTQCDYEYVVTFFSKEGKQEIAILPCGYGGAGTANTHPSVAYYLDQAFRAKSTGAYSGAMAMYRAALDQLMHQEGYIKGMLGNKIGELKADIGTGKAKKWAKDIDPQFIELMNAIGSGSIHPNDGDIQKQSAIDTQLLEIVDLVFAELLDRVYEQPAREAERLQKLAQVAQVVRK